MISIDEQDLKGKILFFMPSEEGPSYFTDSLIYMCDHNEHGSLGLIINRPLNLNLSDLFQGMKIETIGENNSQAFLGGPVNPGAIFILHTSDKIWKNSLKVTDEVFMSTDYEAIEDIARGNRPKYYILTLGYTGWGPEQLNGEISDNAWISFPGDKHLIFEVDPADQINEISNNVGYDIRMISTDYGNA